MSPDFYAGAAQRWAEGAAIVYGPIAKQLIATAPHSFDGRTVLDAGAGTGIASALLREAGARPIAADLSFDMLAWGAATRPPATVADVRALPIRDEAVDDAVAAFVLNHLVDPASGLNELNRVTRRDGALLACVYGTANRSEARDAIDEAAQREGWQIPRWYSDVKRTAVPMLGTAEAMERVARQAGLADVTVSERPVDVGVTTPEQLVAYRLGQAHYSPWLSALGPVRAEKMRAHLVEVVRPVMRPYLPIVVFLAARIA